MLHLCAPGPAGVAAALIGRVMGLPIAGSYHTELAAYTALRSGDARLAAGVEVALGAFYGGCDTVLSPSAVSDRRLRALGIEESRIGRWDRGVDLGRFSPPRGRRTRPRALRRAPDQGEGRRPPGRRLPGRAGARPAPGARPGRRRAGGRAARPLGSAARFLGWLEGTELARAYADADLFLFCSQTDTFGQVVLEAQASRLPVVAVEAGGPAELIASGRSGVLCPPRTSALADAISGLAAHPSSRRRLTTGGIAAVRGRTWEASLSALGAGWRRALAAREAASARVRAA